MESVSDSLLRAVCPSLLLHELAKVATSCTYYLYFWGQKDWRFFMFFIFFLSRCSQHHYYIIVLFVVKHFFTIFWKKFEKSFKPEVWIKMLNRNRCRFYNEVISLTLLFHQGKYRTLQWVCQCFSMFSIEEMWAIDLYRLVRMLLLSFEYHGWDLNPYAPKSNGF